MRRMFSGVSTSSTMLRDASYSSRSVSSQAHPNGLSRLAGHRLYTTEAVRDFASRNPILLRDACQCSQCVDPSSHQRDFDFTKIPSTIQAIEIEKDASSDLWKIRWNDDIPGQENHTSEYPESSLTQLLEETPTGLTAKRTVSLWDQSIFAEETKDIKFDTLLRNDDVLAQSLELIQRHGLVFISEIPEDEDAVMRMVTRLTGLYRNTFYGESWDVRSVPQAKNVAYTSKILGFHMDLLYMKEPPGLQLLHCLHNSCTGGESEFADTFKALDILKQEQSHLVSRLLDSQIRYGYNNDPHFYSDHKPVIKVSKGRHLPVAEFLHAADPAFMQTVECIYWSPPFINSIANATNDGDMQAFLEASKAFVEVMHRPQLVYETKLPAGTCAVFDNLRVVHARKAFDMNSGRRWLKGIYGDRQDLLSKSLKHVWNK